MNDFEWWVPEMSRTARAPKFNLSSWYVLIRDQFIHFIICNHIRSLKTNYSRWVFFFCNSRVTWTTFLHYWLPKTWFAFIITGVPELGIPAIEPLIIPKIELQQGTKAINYKAVLTKLNLYGLSNYKVDDLS